jgi:hypothetical protein
VATPLAPACLTPSPPSTLLARLSLWARGCSVATPRCLSDPMFDPPLEGGNRMRSWPGFGAVPTEFLIDPPSVRRRQSNGWLVPFPGTSKRSGSVGPGLHPASGSSAPEPCRQWHNKRPPDDPLQMASSRSIQQFIKDDAKRPDVSAMVDGFTLHLLG